MGAWEINTRIPIYSDEAISSSRKELSIMINPNWAFASDEAVIAEFDKTLRKALEPPPLPSYDYFSKSYPSIDWHAIGMRVGKLYLDSKRRRISDDTTK